MCFRNTKGTFLKKRVIYLSHMFFILFAVILVTDVLSHEVQNGKEFYLENGLKVIVIPDNSCALAAVVVRVGAGAAYETSETSGMSHLLEHLVFDVTFKRTAREIQDLMDENGAYLNAFTRHDYTAYEAVVPADKLELAFEVQSDMLFYSIIPEDQLAKERNVVIEEIKKDKDDPQTISQDTFYHHLFGGTPYQYPVIGSEYNIMTLSREAIVDYYRTYYRPNNMTLIVMGDFNIDEAGLLARRYYGSIPPSVIKSRATLERFAFSAGDFQTFANVPNTFYSMALPGPSPTGPSAAAFEILVQILAGSETAPLIASLGKAGLPVVQASGNVSMYRNFGFLEINLILEAAFHDVDRLKEMITSQLRDFPIETITPEQIDRVKLKLIADLIFEKEKFLHYARFIAHQDSLGDRSSWKSYEERFGKVELTDVQQAFKTYLKDARPLVSIIRPFSEQSRPSSVARATDQTIKRQLGNGLTVIVRENRAIPVVGLNVLLKDRSSSEPSAGVAHFVSSMLDQGTETSSRTDLQTRLENMGGRLQLTDNPYFPFDNYYFTQEYDYLRLEYLSAYWTQGLEYVKELLFSPAFPERELEIMRSTLLGELKMTINHPAHRARQLFYKTLFGTHPYSQPLTGTHETIAAIQRSELIEYHRLFYRPDNMIITIVGDVDANNVHDKLAGLFGPLPSVSAGAVLPQTPEPVQDIVTVTEEVQSEQTCVFLGNILHCEKSDEAPLTILFAILNERLQNSVREQHGLAYNVGAGVHLGNTVSWYSLSASTRPENIDRILPLMKTIFSDATQADFSDNELTRAINSEIGRSVRYNQRRINQAHFLSVAEFLDAGYEQADSYQTSLKKVTIDDLQKALASFRQQTGYIVAIAGPSAPGTIRQKPDLPVMKMH